MADEPTTSAPEAPPPAPGQETAGSSVTETKETTLLGGKAEESSTVLGPDGKPAVKEEPKADTKTEASVIDPAKITLPDGFKADEPVLKAAVDLLSDDKLSPQERAQKLIDLHSAELKKATDANTKYWSDLQTKWKDEAKTAYGPEPAKNPSIIAVSKLIDSLGEKPASELRDALEMSGMGNHPAVIGAFVKLAERLTETGGTITATKPSPAKPTSFGDALYGNSTSGA